MTLVGDKNIFQKASSSKMLTEEQQAKEKLEIVLSDLEMDKHTNYNYNEIDYIDEKLKSQNMLIKKIL